MKFKVSKVLTGISALVIAGIMCVVPFNMVQAAGYSRPNAVINVVDPATGPRYQINGSLYYSFTGADPSTIRNYDMTIFYHPNGYRIVDSLLDFNSPIDQSGTCSVEFSFTLQNIAYHGVVNLDNMGNGFVTDGSAILDNFVDTRNLAAAEAFSRSINTKIDEIEKAVQGLNADGTVNETKTVEYNYNYAINEKIIEKLSQAEGVTLLYTFEYEGYVFTSAITSEDAAKIFSKDSPWYGPCYIASNCPTVMVGVAN